MATRTDYFIQKVLDHLYLNTAIANIGDVSGLPAAATAGDIYVALLTAGGEATYTPYTRQTIARSSSGFSRTGNVMTNVANITFPKCTSGSDTITKIALYDGAVGNKLHEQTLGDPIAVSTNVQPIIEAGELTITGS
jgi:hypothetical protein